MINSFVYSFLYNQYIQPTHRGPGRLPFVALIDLGKEENLCGFKYYPEQNLWQPGIIRAYQFYVSTDNKEWKLVDEGNSPTSKNNPMWQTKKFTAEKARYIILRALKNTEDNDNIGYAEVDVISIHIMEKLFKFPLLKSYLLF